MLPLLALVCPALVCGQAAQCHSFSRPRQPAAMRNHGAAVDLQIAACQALRVLTRAAECQDTVLAIGGAGAVVGALTAHVGVAKVQEVGCRAVQNLVFRKDECVAAVIAA
eukprot:COSAG01_NODE_44019_length_423_cov_1.194444_1_plen_109_part_01